MTQEELAAIVEGIAPVVRDYVKQRGAALALEVHTLRESLLPQLRTLETRNAALETRCEMLETRCQLLEFEASAVTGRP